MALNTQPYKGARDFYPEDKRLQDYIFGVWRRVAQSYGYEEYDAPLIEPLDLYRAKTGDEIVNEQVYSFTDRGGREVAIRPEMTPSVSRMVAGRRQELAYPLRWFSVHVNWRYERPQRGRLREFWQLDADIFGESGIAAEAEMIQIANQILRTFGAKPTMYEVRINSRVHMNTIFDDMNLNDEQKKILIQIIDKKEKLDRKEFEKLFYEKLHQDHAVQLIKFLKNDKPPENVQMLLAILKNAGIENVVYKPSLARGFEYYTDIVFEVFDTHPDNNRSMFGGGRYDGLVGLFGVEPIPTVGFAMGDVTLANFLNTHGLLPEPSPTTELAVVLIGDIYDKALKVINQLRAENINVSVDATDRKIDKKLKNLAKQGVRYALFIGENELANEQYPLKDLVTGAEEKHSVQRTVSVIKDYRKSNS